MFTQKFIVIKISWKFLLKIIVNTAKYLTHMESSLN